MEPASSSTDLPESLFFAARKARTRSNVNDHASSSSAPAPSPCEYYSARIHNMMERTSELNLSQEDAEIEASKDHWTVVEPDHYFTAATSMGTESSSSVSESCSQTSTESERLALYEENTQEMRRLQEADPESRFFRIGSEGLVMVRKIAEGSHGNYHDYSMLYIIFCIAWGMKDLHGEDTLHRDLKAANVLVFNDSEKPYKLDPIKSHLNRLICLVTDYECSIGVVGTGYWRAPEILQALKNRSVYTTLDLVTPKMDVYSFAMTCYEVLTGLKPFEEVQNCNEKAFVDEVLQGRRPTLPRHLQPWMVELMNKCWHMDPSERPTFDKIFEILDVLPKNKSMFLKSMDDNYRHC